MKKKVMVINLGGTITAEGEHGSTISYREGTYGIEKILQSVYNVDEIADIYYENMLSVASCDITLDNLLGVAKHINQMAKDDEYDGFVITHGTDTLEETAYFLHLTLTTCKPVVITGAMRPATSTSPDGPLNLYQSILVASDDKSYGNGVLVVFSDSIYCARDVQKISTFHVEAFSSRDLGCLGYIRDRDVIFLQTTMKPHTTMTEFDIDEISELPNVEIFYFSIGCSLNCFRNIEGTNGIILAGAGDSCISKKWMSEVKKITDANIPVVRASRVATGTTVYDELTDDVINSIPSNSLPPHKARILLMLALTKTSDVAKIKRIFEEY